MEEKTVGDLRVLVVDDEKLVATLLKGILVGLGVQEIDLADSGEQAIDFLGEHTYDLVLSDVMMPGIGGLGLVKHIRETMGAADLPVYAVTAESVSLDEFRQQGFTACFVKPFTRDNVSALLRRTLARGA